MPRWVKQLISYIISFVVYSILLNWKVSIIILGGIAFHECGHLYAAKSIGLRTKGFYLIPFMGGVALIADRYRTYAEKAYVALAGPVAGTVLTALCFGVYLLTGSHFIGSAGYWMGLLNLFNLIPLAMLDGGQIAESITYSISELAGTVYLTFSFVLAAVVLWFFNPILTLVVIFFGVNAIIVAWSRYNLKRKGWEEALPPLPNKMGVKGMVISVASSILTVLILLLLIHTFHTNSVSLTELFHS